MSIRQVNPVTYLDLSQGPSSPTKPNASSASVTSDAKNTTASQAESQMLEDILHVRHALDLFLNSRVVESEEILQPHLCDNSMYYALGRSVLLCLRAVTTFDWGDIQNAVDILQITVRNANRLRAKNTWFDSITSIVRNRLSVENLKAMTNVQRHAELVYAESVILKGVACIVRDETLYSLMREGLHIKSSHGKYMAFMKFIDAVREEAEAGKDVSVYGLDDHFISGVLFGVGCINIALSLLPDAVLRFLELIGFSGDRAYGMRLLESAGGWDVFRKTGVMPKLQGPNEGIRRQFCDLVLMGYHIILTRFIPVTDGDEPFATRVLDYSLQVYPDGMFYIALHGRLLLINSKLEEAKDEYIRAANAQKEWREIQHISVWELGTICLLEQDWEKGIEYYDELCQESNWSKAVYGYFKGLCMFMAAQRKQDAHERKKLRAEAGALMQKVPLALQKVVGKHIPIEKYIARKARKFVEQGNRLLLPDLEVLHFIGGCEFMPKPLQLANVIRIEKQIALLNSESPSYIDDLCLAHYLRVNLCRYLYVAGENPSVMRKKINESMAVVFANANKIKLDHYIYYFTVYEKAQMLVLDGDYDEAEKQINIIFRANEKRQYGVGAGPHAKSKYSLENVLLFRCHTTLMTIEANRDDSSSSDTTSTHSRRS